MLPTEKEEEKKIVNKVSWFIQGTHTEEMGKKGVRKRDNGQI